ncbi:hypothetical protein [Candidatus Deferrimicrobium sp.]|uniref:hypothetical protein n=1 Tax=Candidatus Deferrimicrobium sp. TaxID=3060586 RepID=UPI0027176ECA|nr:hypothetical protein [Candidatus Deferrimicrobium sp.]MDO8738944.1 hypothetical protein [Candidatus Deferrimicrobium sp.]
MQEVIAGKGREWIEMAKLLLLYDTKETDLGRDFKSLLSELDLDVVMIPLSPDKGKTLQEKEKHYFSVVDGAVFLITPGSERDGKLYPSPSVADEMGQAKVAYTSAPERVSYLVDNRCTIQAVDQRSYILFDRENIRSILDAITQVIRNLKDSGLFGNKRIEHQETPGINIPVFSKTIDTRLKAICEALSDAPNGAMKFADFEMMLKMKFSLKGRMLNFAMRDLQTKGLVIYHPPVSPPFIPYWQLSPLGFELVRHEMNLRAQKQFERVVKSQPGKGLLAMALETRGEKAIVEDLSTLEPKPRAVDPHALRRGLLDMEANPPAIDRNALTRTLSDQNELARGLSALESKPRALGKNALTGGLLDLEPKPRAIDLETFKRLKKKD